MAKTLSKRREAMLAGKSHYFTGLPCKRGHVAIRHVGGLCVECVRLYRQLPENKERDRIYSRRYAAKHRKRIDAYIAEWRKNNPEKVRIFVARTKEKNREKNRAISRICARRYARANPEKRRAYEGARRARIVSAIPVWADLKAISNFYEQCPDGYHVDHIVPLVNKHVCGLHDLANLQYLPAVENMRKHNSFVPHVRVGL